MSIDPKKIIKEKNKEMIYRLDRITYFEGPIREIKKSKEIYPLELREQSIARRKNNPKKIPGPQEYFKGDRFDSRKKEKPVFQERKLMKGFSNL